MPKGKGSKRSVSQQQSKLMHAAAANPKVAKDAGVSQAVAKEFVKGDHGRKVGKLPKKKGK